VQNKLSYVYAKAAQNFDSFPGIILPGLWPARQWPLFTMLWHRKKLQPSQQCRILSGVQGNWGLLELWRAGVETKCFLDLAW